VESIPLTKAKARFSGLIDRLIHLKTQTVITKRGKPVAALVPYEEWERLHAGTTGGLAGIPPPPSDLDSEIDRMVGEIYESRTKSRGRSKSEGRSVNKVMKDLIGRSLGLDAQRKDNREEFADLFGVWSKEEAKSFLEAIGNLGKLDKEN
jgi:prevent-host-death family protein